MRNNAPTTTSDHHEPETAIGPQPLGRPGKVLFAIAAFVFGALITFVACAPANAADGMADDVDLTSEAAPYTSQVPPEPVITGWNCKIGMRGQATPGTRVIMRAILATDTSHILAYADIDRDGMIRNVIPVEHIVPGPKRSLTVRLEETVGDDSLTAPKVLTTAHVGNPQGSGC